MFWEKIRNPLDKPDHTLYRIVKMLKHHIKYCPSDNLEEIHIIRKSEFNKKFKQTTKENHENNI